MKYFRYARPLDASRSQVSTPRNPPPRLQRIRQLAVQLVFRLLLLLHCCFMSTEPRSSTSYFTQLLGSELFRFSVALRPQRPYGLDGNGEPRPSTSYFTQLLSLYLFRFNVALMTSTETIRRQATRRQTVSTKTNQTVHSLMHAATTEKKGSLQTQAQQLCERGGRPGHSSLIVRTLSVAVTW